MGVKACDYDKYDRALRVILLDLSQLCINTIIPSLLLMGMGEGGFQDGDLFLKS